MENIFSFTKNDLIKKFESDGKKKFMASQVFDWLYDKKVYKGCTVCGIYTAAVPFVGYVRRVSQSDDIYS